MICRVGFDQTLIFGAPTDLSKFVSRFSGFGFSFIGIFWTRLMASVSAFGATIFVLLALYLSSVSSIATTLVHRFHLGWYDTTTIF
jgi:hypothetical protein